MIEVAQSLAILSAFLTVISFVIWSNWLRGPMLQRLDGRRASNAAPAAFAVKLLLAAFSLGVVAAVLAIGERMFP